MQTTTPNRKKEVVIFMSDLENKCLLIREHLQEITWSELRNLRDAGSLLPGAMYRITDYKCTTTQTDTSTANNQFDIIMTAVSEYKLSERCRAIRHTGDGYFPAKTDFEAWDLWYCIDNDTDRFQWADTANGRGVIYRMIDEFNNDCPYDFKNIKFKRSSSWFSTNSDWAIANLGGRPTVDMWYYTFSGILTYSSIAVIDLSLNSHSSIIQWEAVYNNKISHASGAAANAQYQLTNNIFIERLSLAPMCYNNVIGESATGNTFGYNCNNNSLEYSCNLNIFGHGCTYNVLEYRAYQNNMGYGCSGNTIKNNASSNTFGSSCSFNTIGCASRYIQFSNSCSSNIIGNQSNYNEFGTNCDGNVLGAECTNNTFGNYFQYNKIGNNCNYCKFGNYCGNNTIGNECNYVITGPSSSSVRNYYRYNLIEDGVHYVYFYYTGTSSSSAVVRNITIHRGVAGISSSYKTVSFNEVNKSYNREFGCNSSGTLITWIANEQNS